jgi:chromosome segregation ATPase
MSPDLEAALLRLQTALENLEASTDPRTIGDARREDLETELQLMQDDRSRLAVELESATARVSRLEAATDHVGRRVVAAIGTLGDVLARAEAAAPGN